MIVYEWTRSTIRTLREAMNLNQQGFADLLHYSIDSVSKWERRPLDQPLRGAAAKAMDGLFAQLDDVQRARFDRLLAQQQTQLATATAPDRSVRGTLSTNDSTDEWAIMNLLSRRTLLGRGLSAAVVLPVLDSDQISHLVAALANARRYLDGPVVGYLRELFDVGKNADGRDDEDTQVDPLLTTLGIIAAVEDNAHEARPAARRALLGLGAECAEFAGWRYRDSADFPRSQYWLDRGTEWAQESLDAPMQGYILLKKAQFAYDLREPHRMLTLSKAVCEGAWGLPARVRAEAVQQQARADAMLGATSSVFERQLDQARKILTAEAGSASGLGTHYNDRLLTMQIALCYNEAGQPRRAVEIYEQALTPRQFSPRDYGFFQSCLAKSLALSGEPDAAADTALEAAGQATRSNSVRTYKQLDEVVGILQPWRNRPKVKQLSECVSVA